VLGVDMVMVLGHCLFAQSRYCEQTQFLSMWDYLWSDKEIAQLQVDITENKTCHSSQLNMTSKWM